MSHRRRTVVLTLTVVAAIVVGGVAFEAWGDRERPPDVIWYNVDEKRAYANRDRAPLSGWTVSGLDVWREHSTVDVWLSRLGLRDLESREYRMLADAGADIGPGWKRLVVLVPWVPESAQLDALYVGEWEFNGPVFEGGESFESVSVRICADGSLSVDGRGAHGSRWGAIGPVLWVVPPSSSRLANGGWEALCFLDLFDDSSRLRLLFSDSTLCRVGRTER